ncbi:MAG: amino acid ABC transporter ATP-binding protein [Gemmataceae bacterium]
MINVRNLVKSHGPVRVLDGVTMTVNEGEVAVLIGPSGGGKSTLLRCINGLEPFQSGEVQVQTVRLLPESSPRTAAATLRDLRRRIGMVFQQFNLFPHLSVLDNVTLAPRISMEVPRSEAEAQAKQLLERVGLSDKLAARPGELSGGQQQRVAIARALAVKPKAMLFDEPTSALDPRMAAEVLVVMADLAKDGLTMMVVTHAMGFARRVGHTIHVMHAGKIAESGPPDQIFGSPTTDVTKRFLQEAHST